MTIPVRAMALAAALQGAAPAPGQLILPFETGQLVLFFPNVPGDGCTAQGRGAFVALAPTACAAVGIPVADPARQGGARGGLVMEVGRGGQPASFPLPPETTALIDTTAQIEVSASGAVTDCRIVHAEGSGRDLCEDLRNDAAPFLPAEGTAPRVGTLRLVLFTPADARPPGQ